MDKILVDLFVPAIHEHFNIFIPNFLTVKEICQLLGEAIQDMSDGSYVSSGEELLSSLEKMQVLQYGYNFMSYGIQNGEHLMFC